jgi:hypothetical protein
MKTPVLLVSRGCPTGFHTFPWGISSRYGLRPGRPSPTLPAPTIRAQGVEPRTSAGVLGGLKRGWRQPPAVAVLGDEIDVRVRMPVGERP